MLAPPVPMIDVSDDEVQMIVDALKNRAADLRKSAANLDSQLDGMRRVRDGLSDHASKVEQLVTRLDYCA